MPYNDAITEISDKYFNGNNEYIFGFADLSGLLDEEYSGFPYALVIGRKLDDDIIDSIINGPSPDYYVLYTRVNSELSEMLSALSQDFKAAGINSLSMEPTVEDRGIDKSFYKTLRLNFSHKMAATRAGLGWIGKTDLFISEAFGPRLRLATILIDQLPNFVGTPIKKSRCGDCTICVDKCPAQAATGKPWDTTIDRDIFFDAFKCRQKCLELSERNLNKKISLCGICVSVCPIGKINC